MKTSPELDSDEVQNSGRHNWTRTNDPHHVKVML